MIPRLGAWLRTDSGPRGFFGPCFWPYFIGEARGPEGGPRFTRVFPVFSVDMCWIHRLGPRILPAQGKRELPYLSSSPRKDGQRTAPEWPRLPPQGSRGQLTSMPSYRSPPSLPPFTTGIAMRTHPALALFSLCLP
jgi:hypothetical protein